MTDIVYRREQRRRRFLLRSATTRDGENGIFVVYPNRTRPAQSLGLAPAAADATSSDIDDGRCLLIAGGRRLEGEVRVSGSKNATLPLLASALLTEEPTVLANVPRLTDIETMVQLLRGLGAAVTYDTRADSIRSGEADAGATLHVRVCDSGPIEAPRPLLARMRAGFCVLGPLLARRGAAVVPLPGGCAIGPRPVDLHLKGLAALGAEIHWDRGVVRAKATRLRGASIDLRGPRGSSVTGTANVLSAAVLARGETTIRGAAREPEIVELGHVLQAMGARIRGLGTSTLQVHGVPRLHGVRHRVCGDRIEAGTLLIAAALTAGVVTVVGAPPSHLAEVLVALSECGCHVRSAGHRIRLCGPRRPRGRSIAAAPYPGIPTDLQAQWTVLMTQAVGPSRIGDLVFPSRFGHIAALRRMGAVIADGEGEVTVEPGQRLRGAEVEANDLRAGAALVLAGLVAEGVTRVRGLAHLERGYERLDRKLCRLGAEVDRVSIPSAKVG